MTPFPALDSGCPSGGEAATGLLHQSDNVSIEVSQDATDWPSHRVEDLKKKHGPKPPQLPKPPLDSDAYCPVLAKRCKRLELAVNAIVARHGYDCVGFHTLTFKENLTDWKEAEKRFASYEKNVLSQYCQDWVLVVQVQERGAIHYHMVLGLAQDIRTGTDIKTIKNRALPRWMRYSRKVVNPNLRNLWRNLCARARGDGAWEGGGYKFGRVELMPFEKPPEAVARYMATYLKPGADMPGEYRKKKKLRFSKSVLLMVGPNFQRNTFGSYVWRKKLELTAREFGMYDYNDLADYFGPRWFHHLRDAIRLCPFEANRADWDRGLAEKVWRKIGVDVWDLTNQERLARGDQALLDWQAAKAKAWERLQDDLKTTLSEGGDPDWFVPYFEFPEEWQLQLLLMNYQKGVPRGADATWFDSGKDPDAAEETA